MFAILENGSVETMLRYRLRFSTGRAFAIPTGQSKTRMTVMTLRSCARTFIAGRTMSIIESLLVLWRLVARAKQSAPSGGNGRRVISVDRPLRLRTAPRERPGCSPASLPPEGTSWPFSRCIGPDGPPVGGVQQLRLPWFSRKMYVYLRVSGVSLPALLGGLGWAWRYSHGVIEFAACHGDLGVVLEVPRKRVRAFALGRWLPYWRREAKLAGSPFAWAWKVS